MALVSCEIPLRWVLYPILMKKFLCSELMLWGKMGQFNPITCFYLSIPSPDSYSPLFPLLSGLMEGRDDFILCFSGEDLIDSFSFLALISFSSDFYFLIQQNCTDYRCLSGMVECWWEENEMGDTPFAEPIRSLDRNLIKTLPLFWFPFSWNCIVSRQE